MFTTTFTHADAGFGEIIAMLASAGLSFGSPRVVRRTVLDTFDGRLYAAGMRLEHVAGPSSHLALFAAGSLPATIGCADPPRFAADLPGGPFGARIRPLLEMRALLPVISFEDRTTTAIIRNSAEKAVATIVVHDTIATEGGASFGPTVEVVAATGHTEPADELRTVAMTHGLFTIDDDVIGLVLRAASVDPAGFRSDPTVELHRHDPAAASFRSVLANLARTIDANWQGTVDDIDTEFLHELRVAVRRTRSVIGQAKRVLPESLRSRFRDDFAWLAHATGPTRDLDVYALEWPKYIAGMSAEHAAALGPVLDHIEHHRVHARADLVEVLTSDRAAAVMAAWHTVLTAEPDDTPSQAGAPIGRAVAKRFRQAHETVLHQGRLIDAESPAEHLHDLRKDAKKLRYLVECFGGVMPAKLRKSFIKHLKGLQDNLGEHQDAEVHATELNRVAAELGREQAGPATTAALAALTDRLDQTQREARSEFAHRFSTYDSSETEAIIDHLLSALVAP